MAPSSPPTRCPLLRRRLCANLNLGLWPQLDERWGSGHGIPARMTCSCSSENALCPCSRIVVTEIGMVAEALSLVANSGLLALTALAVASGLFFLPRPVLCLLGGAAFGFWAVPAIVIGTTAGAAAA